MRYAICIVAVILGGCTNFYPPTSVRKLEPNARYLVSHDSSRRGAWIATDATGKVTSCAEPAPDVALSLSTGLKADISAGGVEAKGVDASAASTALALAGRDNVVLLAREALFRICEQQAMGNLTPDQVRGLFKEVFFYMKEIAVAQATKEEAKAKQLEEIAKAAK